MERRREMLIVETIGKIRRDYFVHGKTIKAIARELGLSRNTVRKVLRARSPESALHTHSTLSSDSGELS